MSTKRSRILNQTCSWKLQVCLSKRDFLVETKHWRVKGITCQYFYPKSKTLWKFKTKKLKKILTGFTLRELLSSDQILDSVTESVLYRSQIKSKSKDSQIRYRSQILLLILIVFASNIVPEIARKPMVFGWFQGE